MSRADSKNCGICQTRFGDTDCVHRSGRGSTDDPYKFTPNHDPITGNLLECSKAGWGAFLPPIYLDPPCCCVYATVEQPIAYDTAQHLYFNEDYYDTDNMHDSDGDLQAQGSIKFNTPGVYLVTLNVRWKKIPSSGLVSSLAGDQAAFIERNGSDIMVIDSKPIPYHSDTYGAHSLAIQDYFETGEFVGALVKQDAVNDEREGLTLPVTVHRMSPIFAASFIRAEP